MPYGFEAMARSPAPSDATGALELHAFVLELGALDAVSALREIGDWMDRHPREVVVIVVEDATGCKALIAAHCGIGALISVTILAELGDARRCCGLP